MHGIRGWLFGKLRSVVPRSGAFKIASVQDGCNAINHTRSGTVPVRRCTPHGVESHWCISVNV